MGLGLAACGPAAPLSSQARQGFLNAVYSGAPDVQSYRTGAQLVSMGQAVCLDLEAGANILQVADRVQVREGSSVLPTGDLGVVISAAVHSICPQFSKDLST